MSVYLLSYDIHKGTPEEYVELENKIKSYNSIHPLESVWIIDSNLDIDLIYSDIKLSIVNDDIEIILVNISNDIVGRFIDTYTIEWLNSPDRTWKYLKY